VRRERWPNRKKMDGVNTNVEKIEKGHAVKYEEGD